MWKFAVVLLFGAICKGQDQFLREVKNPSGPSISILRGGGFPRNGNGDESGIQPLNAGEDPNQANLVDSQRLQFQVQESPQEQPIPQGEDPFNPFTNGENGFGLRYQTPSQPQIQQPQQPQAPQPQLPQQAPQQPQGTPLIQQHPITTTVPQLIVGQTYVDQFGRLFVYGGEQPQAQVQRTQPQQQQQNPQPSPAPVPTQQQTLVDTYGREISQIEVPAAPIVQEVAHHVAVPVAHQVAVPVAHQLAVPVAHQIAVPVAHHHVATPVAHHVATPVAHHVATPVAHEVAVPVPAAPKVLVPGATLKTYAVPAFKKVNGLTIPFAQKVVLAAKIPAKEIVHPAAVPAPALVKSRHRTIVTSGGEVVEVPQPVVVEQPVVPAAVPVAHPAPLLVKKVKSVVPAVTFIHQPVFPKPVFQQHIFNVKHGSEPVIYQDLCTVYPFQKNIRACVLKKAVLPELHHPDIRTINVEGEQSKVEKTVTPSDGSGLFVPVPIPDNSKPTVTITKNPPNSIQETIRRESEKRKMDAEAAAAAATMESTTTVQPQPIAAESKTTESSTAKPRRRKNARKSLPATSTTTTEKPFVLQ